MNIELEKHRPYLTAVARRLVGPKADPQDLVQETYVRALKRYETFDGRNLRGWLVRILQNTFTDQYRWQSRRPETSLDAIEREVPAEPPEALEPWQNLTFEDIRTTLPKLKTEFREVFELFYFEKCSYQDIARRLEIQERTVGTRLWRARLLVRRQLERRLEDPTEVQA